MYLTSETKLAALALLIGLAAGPYISNFLGWQVTSGTALTLERAGIVERLAAVCDAQARTEVQDPSKLDWDARGNLAKKWAIMPGATSTDTDVMAACAEKLARAVVDVLPHTTSLGGRRI
jgi:hypothetical protein